MTDKHGVVVKVGDTVQVNCSQMLPGVSSGWTGDIQYIVRGYAAVSHPENRYSFYCVHSSEIEKVED